MPRYVFFLIIPCILVLLSGCAASLPYAAGGDCYNKSLPILLDSTDLIELFQDIAAELCVESNSDCVAQIADGKGTTQICTNREENNRMPILVTDFADIQTFLPNQSGLLMGELMRGSLNKVCDYKIIQAEFAKYFKLSEKGLVVLTRKVNEIKKDTYSQPEAVVGTYNYLNNNKVLIFARRINTETGKISRMVAREINYSCTGKSVRGYIVK